jgi:multidrug efflux system outer membrane protein
MTRLSWVAILVSLCVAACTVGPNFVRPGPAGASTWHDPVAAGAPADLSGAITTTADPQPDWWRQFNDSELATLIDRATHGNLDLQIAVQRIAVARSGEVSAAAAGLPSLSGSASYTRQQAGLDQLLGQIGSAIPVKPTQPPPAFGLYQGALDASWEIDLFGKVRRSEEASKANVEASIGDRDDALVSLQAEVAQTYVQLRTAQASLATSRADIVTERDLLGLTGDRSVNGLNSSSDVRNAEAQLASSQAASPQYELQIATSLNALAVLVGQTPGALDAELAQAQPIPHLASSIAPIGLPASLARRRPDIRAAEARLHEGTANVGAAIAQLYPDITLTGDIGQQSQQLKNFAKSYDSIYSFAPSISLPIFQGGRIRANIAQAKAQQVEALLTYQKTVLAALQDVENALAAYRTDQQRLQYLKTAVAADRAAVEIALDRYRHGISTYLDVLNPQSSLIQAEQQRIQAEYAVTNDLVTIYKALGGGWQAQSLATAQLSDR